MLKGVETYDLIETNQDEIEIANLIRSICHLKCEDKQDVMDAVETDKHVYLFYQGPNQSNMNYAEAYKS